MKLIFFTILMIVIPIGAFFVMYALVYDWRDEGLAMSGFVAVASTNVVVVAYIAMAWNEDAEDMKRNRLIESKEKVKKES